MEVSVTTVAKTLHEKFLAAAQEAGFVSKSSQNTQQHYKFAGDEAISNKFREAMLKQGLLAYPTDIKFDEIQTIARDGKDTPNVLVSISGYLTITDGAESIMVASLGQGMDVGDKAAYKALTGFKKYAYRMAVMMVTGDDPEIARADEGETDSTPAIVNQIDLTPMFTAAQLAGYDLSDPKSAGAFKALVETLTSKTTSKDLTTEDMENVIKALTDEINAGVDQPATTVA